MRVAMVLDVTGSMADNGKMAAMQTAAQNLIDQFSALARIAGDVSISIVPFSKDINIGSSNDSRPCVDFTDRDAANGSWGGTSENNCSCNNWSQIDARQNKLCDNAKAPPDNINIYTVQVNTGGAPRASCNIAQAAPINCTR